MKGFSDALEAVLVSLHKVIQQELERGDKATAEKAAQQVINLRKELKLHEKYVSELENKVKSNTDQLNKLTRIVSGVGKTLAKAENEEILQRAAQDRKKGG